MISLNTTPSSTASTINLNGYQAPVQISTESNGHQQHAAVNGAISLNRAVTDYQKMDHRTHVYTRPDTYAGSDQKEPREARILNYSDPNNLVMFIPESKVPNITLPEAVEHIFSEILANAEDAVEHSRRNKVEGNGIIIIMDEKRITVRNGGIPIPIAIHPQYQQLVPEMIFGNLLTSSNYNDDQKRTVQGRNGYGAKLTNIFSKEFTVSVGNKASSSCTGKHYTQTWRDNMLKRDDPIITENYQGEDFVEISFVLDFARFGYECYPAEAFYLFASHAADASFVTKEKVTFNNVVFNYPQLKEYSKLFPYYDEDEKLIERGKLPKNILHYTWKDENVKHSAKDMPDVEVIVLDTPRRGQMISFVNGSECREGGAHVDKALHAVCDNIIKEINEKFVETGKEKKAGKIDIGHVRRHITIIIACRVINPQFGNQYKTKFTKPVPTIKIPEKLVKVVRTWRLAHALILDLQQKTAKGLGKSKKKNFMDKCIDANWADKKRPEECSLLVMEGDSASNFAELWKKAMGPDANNRFGIYMLGGKPMNLRTKNIFKILRSLESGGVGKFFNCIGLEPGTNYADPANRKKRRYGKVIMVYDADADGNHIGGLVVSNFEHQFKELLHRYNISGLDQGFLYFMRTRYIILSNGLSFYTEEDYEAWLEQDPNNDKIKGRYLKGLGSNLPKDVAAEAANPQIVELIFDEHTHQSLQLAFGPSKNYSSFRKDWISQRQKFPGLTQYKQMPISTYVNIEVIKHPVDNVLRSIPRITDFLKESQRKGIYGSIKKFGWKFTNEDKAIKLYIISSYCCGETGYHHGDASFTGMMTRLAQDIVGINNMPLMKDYGLYGSRLKMGKNAASPRYVSTGLPEIFQYYFPIEDKPLFKFRRVDGIDVEPQDLYPVLPTPNGVDSIATGWSSFMPNLHPLELYNWYVCRLWSKELPEIMPYYRHFKGEIIVKPRKKKENSEKDTDESDESTVLDEENDDDEDVVTINEEDGTRTKVKFEKSNTLGDGESLPDRKIGIDKDTKFTMETRGIFRIAVGNIVHIDELPIGISTMGYKKFLDDMIEGKIEGNSLDKYETQGDDQDIHFILHGLKRANHKALKLTRSFGLSNMTLLDENNKPHIYTNLHDILEYFFQWRYKIYIKRLEYNINHIKEQINELKYKLIYYQLVLDGKVKPVDEDVEYLTSVLKQHGVDYKLVKQTKIANLTKQGLEKIRNKITELEKLLIEEEAKTPAGVWLNDLNNFAQAYCKIYNCQVPVMTQRINNYDGCLYRFGDGPIKYVKQLDEQKGKYVELGKAVTPGQINVNVQQIEQPAANIVQLTQPMQINVQPIQQPAVAAGQIQLNIA